MTSELIWPKVLLAATSVKCTEILVRPTRSTEGVRGSDLRAFKQKGGSSCTEQIDLSTFSDTFTLSYAFVWQINRIPSIRESNKEAQKEGAILLSLIS